MADSDRPKTIDHVIFPTFATDRGYGYWMNPRNLWAARNQRIMTDFSVDWRRAFPYELIPEKYRDPNGLGSRSAPFASLTDGRGGSFRFLILGDTGEGDRSQYSLLPLIRALKPDFMVINGDVAYPAGRAGANRDTDDYLAGFFEPYRDLDIPIWAVPGNHEYYADGKGREFFEVFCTESRAADWYKYGLKLVPQPGTYWELQDTDTSGDLVLIGIDSARNGNLDGHHAWWQPWKRQEPTDHEQLAWLAERLRLAQAAGRKVIVLFHIPQLVNSENKSGVYLSNLHRILGSFPCVRMVITAHTHNYQRYEPGVFADYLRAVHGFENLPDPPHYIMSGRGGAYLNATTFKGNDFPCSERFPSEAQWRDYCKGIRRVRRLELLQKNLIGKAVAFVDRDSSFDDDTEDFLSMLLVEVDRTTSPAAVRVTPVYLQNLAVLYGKEPEVDISITDPRAPLLPGAVTDCLRPPIIL
jgi:3',5'-cyclic AMP phosphodiesterase CpdA